MKKGIHPKIYEDCVVTCACGNTFTTISTQEAIRVEICGLCHPFYTGQQKFIDTEGRIEKFQKKLAIAKSKQTASKEKKQKKQESAANPSSLKDLLKQARSTNN